MGNNVEDYFQYFQSNQGISLHPENYPENYVWMDAKDTLRK